MKEKVSIWGADIAKGLITWATAAGILWGLAVFFFDFGNEVREIRTLPEQQISVLDQLKIVTKEISEINEEIKSLRESSPALLDFSGGGEVAPHPRGYYRPGEVVTITYLLRRNATCETDIRVQFYDWALSQINPRYTSTIPALKSAVSREFTLFSVPVALPPTMDDGFYSYAPEIIPLECGVYKSFKAPLSGAFEVRND